MNRIRFAAVTMAVLMLASAVVFVAPAATAQDVLPTRRDITLEPIPNLPQRLYLRYDTQAQPAPGQQPGCAAPFLALQPGAQDPAIGGGTTSQCAVTTETVYGTPAALTPNRGMNFTGNNSFLYHHRGAIPSGQTLTITVKSGGSNTLASGTITGADGTQEFTQTLTLAGTGAQTGHQFATQNLPLTVTLTPTGSAVTLPGNVAPVGSTIRIEQTNSYLELRAEDAVRAATWITDEKDALRNVFAPIANESQLPADRDRRFVGHFALASALGSDDAGGAAPNFTVLRDGRPIEVAAGGATVLVGQRNSSASVSSAGVNVWSFPAGSVNYRGFMSGAYTLRVDKTHHQGSSISRGVEKMFNITSQSVDLKTFTDSRVASLAETQAHTVQSGGSTTYVLAVSNTGAVNDTFTINLTAANAPPGWGATIGGPDVLSRRIAVPARETRVFTVTVNAPFSSSGEVIHLVNVTSTIDPGARSKDMTLVTTIGSAVTRDVGIIVLASDLSVEPGVETHFPIYVWNRGTRVANVSLEIIESAAQGWTVDLAFGNANVDRMVLSSIQPGDFVEATLEVTGPITGAFPTHAITLNATQEGVAGISFDRALTFSLRSVTGLSIQVFNAIGGRSHVAELEPGGGGGGPVPVTPPGGGGGATCNVPGDAGCPDGLDGLWFRVWVTNTGRLDEPIDFSVDTIRFNCNSPAAFAGAANGLGTASGAFGFYTRTPSGGYNGPVQRLGELKAGNTSEHYLWLPVAKTASCATPETISFVVQARGGTSGAIARQAADASARNGDAIGGLYLEGVSRLDGYSASAPLVDIANATKRTILGSVRPGENTSYFVRVTNAASWTNFTAGGRIRASDVHVSLVGVDYEGGWNVSVRPVKDSNEHNYLLNPLGYEANVSNVNTKATVTGGIRREGWFDQELEVVVQAPSVENGTAVAGLRHEFQIIAETNHSNDKSTLEIATVIGNLANITAKSDRARILAHPGEAAPFLLTVSNIGSSSTDVTLRAAMTTDTQSSASWQVSPNAQRFPLPAFKNRTIALLITPPAGATQGTVGNVVATLEYTPDPIFPNKTVNVTLPLSVDVTALGPLRLSASSTEGIIAPGGIANFTMTVTNAGGVPSLPFVVNATPIPNWTVEVGPATGRIDPGQSQTITLVLRAPSDVQNDTRFASVVRVEESQNSANFASLAFGVNVLGGKALPRLNVPNLVKRVDRDGLQNFEVQVQNVGSAAGRLGLEVRSADPAWSVGITDSRGNNISSVQLGINDLTTVNVTVRAPFTVPERTVVPIELTAFSPDLTQAAKATLSAEVHDYGVQLSITPSAKDGLPGLPTEFTVKLRNTGNDNDTLNVSANLIDLPEWSIQLSSEEVRLEPNQEIEVRATIRSPTGPLPSARAYTFPFWVGTRGGQEVNLSKNMTTSAVVTIPNYRSYDVDRDGQLEIAVDLDKRQANGFEEFRDVFTEGIATQVVARGDLDGRASFFLDVPRDRPYDGVADLWFNPETVYAYEILHHPDITGDGTPDYFLDVDRDGKIDSLFDSASERFRDAVEVKVFGDDRIQYLVDINEDGKPDRFYDPESGKVTRTQSGGDVGQDYVGIDVDDDERVDYYYNTKTKETSQAEATNVKSFAASYWYFFVAFLALVILSVVLIAKRRKAP